MFAYISINSFIENYFSSFLFGLLLFVSFLFVLVGSFVCDLRFRHFLLVCFFFAANFLFTNYSMFVKKDVNHFSVENPSLYIIIQEPHVNHFSVENAFSPHKGVNHFSVDNPTFYFCLVGLKSDVLAALDFELRYGNVNHFSVNSFLHIFDNVTFNGEVDHSTFLRQGISFTQLVKVIFHDNFSRNSKSCLSLIFCLIVTCLKIIGGLNPAIFR